MVDDDDYLGGYVQGFRAIMGGSRPLPGVPPQPATRAGRTAFQMGLMEGVARGCRAKGLTPPDFLKAAIPVQPAAQLRRQKAR